jgi:predicted transcriptional regulator
MERWIWHAVDLPNQENAIMQRVKHPPMRNKIDLTDPCQVRAWTRRLRVPADALKVIVAKVGNSVAAVTKEVELQRAGQQPSPAPPIQSSLAAGEPVGTKLSSPV